MGILEIGTLASAIVSIVTLTSRIVKLITTVQSLIDRLDLLQNDMTETKCAMGTLSEETSSLDDRLGLIEYELAIV